MPRTCPSNVPGARPIYFRDEDLPGLDLFNQVITLSENGQDNVAVNLLRQGFRDCANDHPFRFLILAQFTNVVRGKRGMATEADHKFLRAIEKDESELLVFRIEAVFARSVIAFLDKNSEKYG